MVTLFRCNQSHHQWSFPRVATALLTDLARCHYTMKVHRHYSSILMAFNSLVIPGYHTGIGGLRNGVIWEAGIVQLL